MAFLRFASAKTIQPSTSVSEWTARKSGKTAASVVLPKYDPDQYLLTHCSIIASVDTQDSTEPLGVHMVDGFQVNRKFSNYLITPETEKYVNNNFDAWERELLLQTFPTFIGGENYVEHIQIPELSKGKIIDAAARDIGDSVYVDILVATERRHKPLIQAITSGQLQTLSMGCQVEYTQCTKCGNVAFDESQLCSHIRFFKGMPFTDAAGHQHKVAELCGHRSDPKSVQFIEASWVANPAFLGAVLRNVLTPIQVPDVGNKVQVAFNTTRRLDPAALQKAASVVGQQHIDHLLGQLALGQAEQVIPKTFTPVNAFDFGDDEPQDEPEAKTESPMDAVVKELKDTLRERAVRELRDEMGTQEAERVHDLKEDTNDTLIKSAVKDSAAWERIAEHVLHASPNARVARKILSGLILYKSGGWGAVQKTGSFTGRDLLAVSRVLDHLTRRQITAGEGRLYKTVIAVGGLTNGNQKEFLSRCGQVMGRPPKLEEARFLVLKGRLYALGS